MFTFKNPNVILAVLMINMFIVMVGVGLITPILPQLIIEFGASGQAIGLLVAAYGITQFLLSPITGRQSDHYGRKIFIVTGMIVFAIAKLIFAVGDVLWMLYVSRLLEGVAAALIVPPMMAYVADITTTEKRARGNSLLSAAMSAGFIIGPGLGGLLAEYGTRIPLWVAAGAAMISVMFSIVCLPESLSRSHRQVARAGRTLQPSLFKQYAKSLQSKYAPLFILVLVMTFGLANFESVLGLYVTKRFQFSPQYIAIILTTGAVIGVMMQMFLVARTIKQFGEQKTIKACLLITSLAYIVLLLATHFWSILLLTSAIFFATAMLRPALNTQLSKMAGDEQGYVAGMNNAYMSMGNIIGPLLAGSLFDLHMFAPFMAGCIILFIAFMMTLRLSSSQTGR
ncbi:MFS transporter [Paenibacillus hunanensis]|uniref:DHA1 family multidrug resistance protein-like MFS transporter n=1 Tax=Paenibacillus hunanensis TaxID=539262 RepID=A0ABU1J5Z5_9BACL|nr:MFS transporter [Paenibacillus hunanensis]MDR6246650.1 DHA1 family multidrug resistance protein-like MFS transporter [Paenibacillus hunanensis]GGJ00704.1 tetracycline resistance MFS efflux pump [Paenibacillus hunanensis]